MSALITWPWERPEWEAERKLLAQKIDSVAQLDAAILQISGKKPGHTQALFDDINTLFPEFLTESLGQLQKLILHSKLTLGPIAGYAIKRPANLVCNRLQALTILAGAFFGFYPSELSFARFEDRCTAMCIVAYFCRALQYISLKQDLYENTLIVFQPIKTLVKVDLERSTQTVQEFEMHIGREDITCPSNEVVGSRLKFVPCETNGFAHGTQAELVALSRPECMLAEFFGLLGSTFLVYGAEQINKLNATINGAGVASLEYVGEAIDRTPLGYSKSTTHRNPHAMSAQAIAFIRSLAKSAINCIYEDFMRDTQLALACITSCKQVSISAGHWGPSSFGATTAVPRMLSMLFAAAIAGRHITYCVDESLDLDTINRIAESIRGRNVNEIYEAYLRCGVTKDDLDQNSGFAPFANFKI